EKCVANEDGEWRFVSRKDFFMPSRKTGKDALVLHSGLSYAAPSTWDTELLDIENVLGDGTLDNNDLSYREPFHDVAGGVVVPREVEVVAEGNRWMLTLTTDVEGRFPAPASWDGQRQTPSGTWVCAWVVVEILDPDNKNLLQGGGSYDIDAGAEDLPGA